MQSGFLLDVVVGKSSSVFELLASKNESLLVGRNTFLVLNLCFDIVYGIGRFHFECNRFTRECFDENLHGVVNCVEKKRGAYLQFTSES
jgi:hypothetical protein